MPLDPPAQLHRARMLTRALRGDASWASLRDELRRRGLDPADVVLVDSYDEDEGVEAGLLATAGERLIAWRRAYEDDTGASRILEWREISGAWAGTSWGEAAAEYVQAVRNTRGV